MEIATIEPSPTKRPGGASDGLPPRNRWSTIRAGVAVTVLAIGVLMLAVSLWLGHERLAQTAASVPEVGITGKSELAARTVLESFLKAQTWAEKRAWVIDPDRTAKAGEAYFAGRDPEEIRVDEFTSRRPGMLSGVPDVVAFEAPRSGRRPVLAVMRWIDGGWRIDWETFAQTYDESFTRFLREPGFAMQTFRTRVERVFQPGPAEAYRVAVSDALDASQRVEVELPANSLVRDSVAAGLVAEPNRAATVTMCWYRDAAQAWHPMLQELVCWGWRGVTGEPHSLPPPRVPGLDRGPPSDSKPPPKVPAAPDTVAQFPITSKSTNQPVVRQ